MPSDVLPHFAPLIVGITIDQFQPDQAGEELDMVQPLGGAPARESAQTTHLAASAAGRASFSYSRRRVGSFRVFRLRRIRRQSGGLSPRRRQAGSSGPRSFRRLRHQRHVVLYNTQLPQSALGSRTPMQAMKDWQKSHPHLFVKTPRNRPGRDN